MKYFKVQKDCDLSAFTHNFCIAVLSVFKTNYIRVRVESKVL